VSTISVSRRVTPVAAVALGVLTLGLGLAHAPLDLLTHQLVGDRQLVADWLTTAAFSGPAAVVGALVAARRPRNPIGWILLAIFLYGGAPVGDYAVLDYRMHHGTLPLGQVAVVLVGSWPIWLVLIATFLWLFPDGRLAPGRWRGVSVVIVSAGILLGLAASASGVAAVAEHDIHIDASGNLANPAGPWVVLQSVVAFAVLGSLLVWLVAQVPRYRRSSGERRQQLKWLYSGAAVFVVSVVISSLASGNSSSPWQLVGTVGMAVFPVCIGVAVLKYRLYEIDRIISRVITYAIVTAVLAGVFAGLVLLATHVLPVTSPVGVAASTLAAAALFNPLRRRVQRVVDRRFNRAKYNAEAVVAAFTARLRGTVDLDAIQVDLVDAVHHAFEPAHVSLWLTPTGQRGSTPPRPPSRHGFTHS
jgi:hypothetical protein